MWAIINLLFIRRCSDMLVCVKVMFSEKYVNAYFVFYLYEPPPMSETAFTSEILARIVVRDCSCRSVDRNIG